MPGIQCLYADLSLALGSATVQRFSVGGSSVGGAHADRLHGDSSPLRQTLTAVYCSGSESHC